MTVTAATAVVGESWFQDVAEIIATWRSIDGGNPAIGHWDEECTCYYDEEPDPNDGVTVWECLLNNKRGDWGYDVTVDSIRRFGFLRPITVNRAPDGVMVYGDGHHRLAAAIDLGITHIPVTLVTGWMVAADSGEFRYLDEDEDEDAFIERVRSMSLT